MSCDHLSKCGTAVAMNYCGNDVLSLSAHCQMLVLHIPLLHPPQSLAQLGVLVRHLVTCLWRLRWGVEEDHCMTASLSLRSRNSPQEAPSSGPWHMLWVEAMWFVNRADLAHCRELSVAFQIRIEATVCLLLVLGSLCRTVIAGI